jgi:HK97 family phage portal protein
VSLITRAKQALQVFRRGMPPPDDDFWYRSVGNGGSGSVSDAMRVSAIWSCIQVLSNDVAKTPLYTYRRLGNDDQERLDGHYMAQRLNGHAYPQMTSYRFKHLMQTRRLQYGNAYAEMVINERGQVSALLPWNPAKVIITIDKEWGGPVYTYTPTGMPQISRPWPNILHLRGMISEDGVTGLSPIAAARRTIDLATAAEQHGASFYQNGARPGGILYLPTSALKDKDTKDKIREEWQKAFGGGNSYKVATLVEGSKYEPLGMAQSDAEYVATRKLSILDICRIYGVPPHKIAELDRATFSNIEEQQLDYLAGTLGAEFSNWEHECAHMMLSDRDASSIYLKFDTGHLLRGRLKEQMEALGVAVDKGLMTRNEARAVIDLNRIEGADSLLVQEQMAPLEMLEKIHAAKQSNPQPSA